MVYWKRSTSRAQSSRAMRLQPYTPNSSRRVTTPRSRRDQEFRLAVSRLVQVRWTVLFTNGPITSSTCSPTSCTEPLIADRQSVVHPGQRGSSPQRAHRWAGPATFSTASLSSSKTDLEGAPGLPPAGLIATGCGLEQPRPASLLDSLVRGSATDGAGRPKTRSCDGTAVLALSTIKSSGALHRRQYAVGRGGAHSAPLALGDSEYAGELFRPAIQCSRPGSRRPGLHDFDGIRHGDSRTCMRHHSPVVGSFPNQRPVHFTFPTTRQFAGERLMVQDIWRVASVAGRPI